MYQRRLAHAARRSDLDQCKFVYQFMHRVKLAFTVPDRAFQHFWLAKFEHTSRLGAHRHTRPDVNGRLTNITLAQQVEAPPLLINLLVLFRLHQLDGSFERCTDRFIAPAEQLVVEKCRKLLLYMFIDGIFYTDDVPDTRLVEDLTQLIRMAS